jgi:hypothetical protein
VKKLRIIRLIGLVGLISSCSNGTLYMEDKFNGFWAETEWTYEFKKDATFKFYAKGHYGNKEFKGRYIISDSTVFLNPDTDWQTSDGVIKPRLRIMNKECLRDYDNNYYCKNYETIEKLNDKEFEFQEKAISIIDTLSIVKKAKERLMAIEQDNWNVLDGEPEIRISYTGIIVIDRKEFHQFYVERLALLDTWRSLDFLVTKSPFTIFEHPDIRDSLRLIYKETE